MKHTNKKGFTIVELVIVIAVIAILAAVLIPNLSRLVGKANESSAMQAARSEYQAYLAEYAKDLDGTEDFVIIKGDYAFEVIDGQFNEKAQKASSYTDIGKVDLTKNVVKSAKAATTDAPAVEGTTVDKWYTDAKCTTEATTYTAGTEYYYVVVLAEDLGSADVAIYAK